MAQMHVELVTPLARMVSGDFDSVVAPSVSGEVTVLADHLPLLADLDAGVVRLGATGGQSRVFAVSGGFLEVDHNKVTVLAETAEEASEIDTKRAQQDLDDAQTKLKGLGPADKDYADLDARAKRAQARLAAVG